MHQHKVFIVGDSMYAENIAHTLLIQQAVELVGTAPSVEVALPLVKTSRPDVIIVTGTNDNSAAFVAPILAKYPKLPIIRTDLSGSRVQVITSQCVDARSADLLAAIAALPKQQ